MRKDVPGIHKKVVQRLKDDNAPLGYTQWSATEPHHQRLKLGANESSTTKGVHNAMIAWKQEHYADIGNNDDKLDTDVINQFVLDPRHFQYLNKLGDVIAS